MKKVRWGVIGAGGIAQRRTIPGMMQCENAELVAVMEITPELAESCRAKWNCKKAYTSAEELLNDPEIDAVYIASPVFLHAQQAMAAADAGKHILIEKPLAMTAAEDRQAFLEKGRSDCSGLHDALRCLHSGTVLQQCSEQNFSPERTFRTGMVLSICVFPC